MSQSASALSPVPSSHSLALFYDLRLQTAGRLEPLLEESAAFRIGEPEEMVLRALQHRRRAESVE